MIIITYVFITETKNLLAPYGTMSEYKARKGNWVKEERP